MMNRPQSRLAFPVLVLCAAACGGPTANQTSDPAVQAPSAQAPAVAEATAPAGPETGWYELGAPCNGEVRVALRFHPDGFETVLPLGHPTSTSGAWVRTARGWRWEHGDNAPIFELEGEGGVAEYRRGDRCELHAMSESTVQAFGIH